MIRFFGFSPSRLALGYIALSVLALALFAIPLWYAWRVNISTFRAYVQGEDMQKLVDVFDREGPKALVAAMESQAKSLPADQIMVLADASKLRLAGNLPAWPTEVPDAPGTYGLVIDLGGGSTMRVVASHVRLPGGYHFLMGRESVRFQSLVERFWYGIAGAMVIVVVLGAVIGWLSHRALLSEVHEISRTASAIVEGDLSRRVVTRSQSHELETLARTVNGMLEKLARQNVQLEEEIAERRQAEQALHRAHDDLEGLVAERTVQLARANESLRRSEAYLAEAQRLSLTGSFGWNVSSGEIYWSQETFRIFEYDPATRPTVELILQRAHPEDRMLVQQAIDRASRERRDFDFERRLLMPDGSVKHLQVVAHALVDKAGSLEFVGAVRDITEHKRAQEALEKAQAELAHVTRVATLGEMTASIAHEINQPLGAIANSASACLRWLEAQKLEEARQSASRVIAESHRASEIIGRIRALAKKAPARKDWLDVNETIHEVVALVQNGVQRNGVALEAQLSDDVPLIFADRIQLQQVILNLMMNGIEAMSGAGKGPRELWVSSEKVESTDVLIAVRDSGPGLDPKNLDHLFDAFYTTKPQGLGMGLAISRSLIEAHGGRLWATANAPHGAVFQFTLPIGGERVA